MVKHTFGGKWYVYTCLVWQTFLRNCLRIPLDPPCCTSVLVDFLVLLVSSSLQESFVLHLWSFTVSCGPQVFSPVFPHSPQTLATVVCCAEAASLSYITSLP